MHDVFHTALPDGFFWEVLEVLAGPPNVTFKWRHWGTFAGEYMGVAPTGETVEMFGMTLAKVSDDLRPLQGRALLRPEPATEHAGRRLPGRQELKLPTVRRA